MEDPNINNKSGKPSEIISISDIALKGISEQIKDHTKQIESIRGQSTSVITGVLIAAVFIFITIAIELMIFHSHNNSDINDFQREYYHEQMENYHLIENLRQKQNILDDKIEKINQLEKQINELKSKINNENKK